MRETAYQRDLIKKLHVMFPGCYILKNDPAEIQGIPDILILFGDRWAALETKRSNVAHRRPNQEYHVGMLNSMSFAAFIWPAVEEEVLGALQQSFGLGG